jgi:hydrogenase expression/formation protein HypE
MPEFTCPVPQTRTSTVTLAHGSGGRAMHQLLESLIIPAFSNPLLDRAHDGAVFSVDGARLAFTTDSYVVRPLFFPGGDIGTLAINGTVNDLAMCGARPLYLSAGLILEEGLPLDDLRRVVESMQAAARAAGVQVVTGDTKVVDRGKADGLFINTAGVGIIEHGAPIEPSSVRPGDVVIVSGDLGRHGMAIMAAREGLTFESQIESDCAPVAAPVLALLDARVDVHCLRDLTRGGLASALVEIATSTHLHIHIDETAVPVREDVRGACEILGLDPLYVANEGRFVAFVAPCDEQRALLLLGDGARTIGSVTQGVDGRVTLQSVIGATRIVDMLNGDQLPRIC